MYFLFSYAFVSRIRPGAGIERSKVHILLLYGRLCVPYSVMMIYTRAELTLEET